MSTAPRNPPHRAEHIGSLLRPDELVKHRYAVADGSATAESLVPVERQSITDIVKLQQECGIHTLTNGEHSRHQCTERQHPPSVLLKLISNSSLVWGTFFETLNGMEEINLRESGYDQSIFRAYAPGESSRPPQDGNTDSLSADVQSFMHAKTIPNAVTVATGKISHTGVSSFLPELEYMKSILPQDQWKNIKLTITSPSW